MSVPKLYDVALDLRCYAVRLGANLMDRPVMIHDLDVMPGKDHLTAEMLAINPKGSVPVLVDGQTTLTEPASILMHLGRDTAWQAATPEASDWLCLASDTLSGFNAVRWAALFVEPGTAEYASIAPGTRMAKARLRQWEDHLSLATLRGQTFLTGNDPSIADILAFPVFAQSRDLRIEPDAYPALRLWSRRVRALPGFIGMPGIPDYH